jgi:hypothetical protein
VVKPAFPEAIRHLNLEECGKSGTRRISGYP